MGLFGSWSGDQHRDGSTTWLTRVLFYGKDSELTGADREHQEVSMLALQLWQSALVHVNTLLLQRVLAEPLSRRRWATSTGAR